MTDAPIVSVVMNAHNSGRYFREALASALAQTLSDIEVIVWDNASTSRLDELCAEAADARVNYIYTEDKVPLYQARIDAMLAAEGDYVAFLDCDDLWMPSKLERQLAAMARPEVVLSCTDYEYFVDGNWAERKYYSAYRHDLTQSHGLLKALVPYGVCMSSLMFDRQLALTVLPNPTPDWFFIEDLDIVSRLLLRGQLVCVPEALMSYRIHASNASHDRSAYVRELQMWIDDIQTRAIDTDIKRKLTTYYRTQALRSQLAQLVSSGRRLEATHAWRQMPWSVTKVKWLLGLLAPRSVAARLASATGI